MSLEFGLWVPPLSEGLIHSLTFGGNFADVTLADDDTNSILADDANRVTKEWTKANSSDTGFFEF